MLICHKKKSDPSDVGHEMKPTNSQDPTNHDPGDPRV